MTQGPTLEQLIETPELVALSPLLYVAWADGELTESEVEAVNAAETPSLSEVQRKTLARWLDAKNPPSSTELLRLYRFIQERVSRLDARSRMSLVELGIQLADLAGPDDSTRRALEELEAALGIRGVAHELVPEQPPVAQHFDEAAPAFAPTALTRLLDGEYREDWERVRSVLRRPSFRYVEDLPKAEYREVVMDWLKEIAAEGWGALAMPAALGGAGASDRFIKTFEALGMFDLSLVVKFGVQFGLFGGAIQALGTDRHHQRYLPAVGTLKLPGGFAMTELGHGSNVRALETIARFDPKRDCFVLHTPSASARKEWIGNAAAHGQTMVVFAQLETGGVNHGVHAFVVPVRDRSGRLSPGVQIEDCGHKMGLNGVDNGRIWFDQVEVPRDNLLDRYASVDADGTYASPIVSPSRRFFTMLGTLVGGRISVGSAAVTAAKKALTIAIRYSTLRRQFGPDGHSERRILDYKTHQLRLMPRLAATYALHFAAVDLQERWRDREGDDTRELEAHAAGFKAVATWLAIDISQHCRECCGGMGFLTANQICQIRKDVDVFATFEGDNTVLLQLVAKHLLVGRAKELKNDLFGSLLGELKRRASAQLLEKNPFAARRTDPAHLDDIGVHRAAFAFRRQQLLASAAQRAKRRLDAGMDGFDAFTEIQDHLQSLAMAHVYERIHGAFADAIERADASLEVPLRKLCALFALWRLHTDRGWFLENGYFEGSKARAIRRRVTDLSTELRSDAVALVRAFAIPDEAVAAPIAFEGYVERMHCHAVSA